MQFSKLMVVMAVVVVVVGSDPDQDLAHVSVSPESKIPNGQQDQNASLKVSKQQPHLMFDGPVCSSFMCSEGGSERNGGNMLFPSCLAPPPPESSVKPASPLHADY